LIKAVIFDMGGVLLRTIDPSPREALARDYGVTTKELFNIIFTSDSSQKAESGNLSEEDHWNWAFETLGVKVEDRASFLSQWWAGDRMDYELLAFINNLRPAYKTGLLSNAWLSTRDNIAKHWGGLEQYFDVAVFSAEVKMRKPAPEFFHWLLDRLQVKPQEAIFVDDYGVNIEAAKALGMVAIKFCSADQAKQDILDALNHTSHS